MTDASAQALVRVLASRAATIAEIAARMPAPIANAMVDDLCAEIKAAAQEMRAALQSAGGAR